MKITLRTFGLVGFILFAGLFVVTFSSQEFVERVGKEFIKDKIIEKTEQKIQSFEAIQKDSKFGSLVSKLVKKNQGKIDSLKMDLNHKLHEKIADVVTQMANLDCECRNKYANAIESQLKLKVDSLSVINKKLTNFMKGKYMEVSTKLKRDVRIFLFSNVLVFLFLLAASFLQPKGIKQLFLPATLLMTSSVIASYFYIFKQNWFMTIMFGSYVGWLYLLYLLLIFLFLCDIVFNKARVSTFILENTVGAISNISFSLC